MKVSNIAAQQLIDAFTKTKVVATFSDKLIKKVFTVVDRSEEASEDGSDLPAEEQSFTHTFRPFSLRINDEFTSSMENSSLFNQSIVDPRYSPYFETLKDKVIAEIEHNINLRIGKWDILNYLTILEFDLKQLRNKFKISELSKTEEGDNIESQDEFFDEDEHIIYENSNINVQIQFESSGTDGFLDFNHFELENMKSILSFYWDIQIGVIESVLRFIEPRKSIIEKTDDYVKVIDVFPFQPILQWTKSDTDLLELIIALHEVGAIQNATKDLKQKEAIQSFSDFFGKELKDHHKKLNAARYRKKEDPGFIPKIQKALEAYYQALNEKI